MAPASLVAPQATQEACVRSEKFKAVHFVQVVPYKVCKCDCTLIYPLFLILEGTNYADYEMCFRMHHLAIEVLPG